MNIETLVLVNILIDLEFSLLMTVIWIAQKRNRTVGYWVLAIWLTSLGSFFAYLFNNTNNLFWIGAAMAAIWAAFAGHIKALSRFSNARSYTKPVLILGVFFSFLGAYLGITGLDDSLRILIISLSIMIDSAFVILTIFRRRDVDTRPIYRIMIVIYAFNFIFHLWRAGATPSLGWWPAFPLHLLVSSNYLEMILFKTVSDMCIIGLIFQRMQIRLNYLAHHDELTELPNRRLFMALAERELANSRRTEKPCCVLMLDIDHFKRINDRFGHPAGDRALFLFATWLRRSLRQHDVLARLGGEEFCAFLPDTDEADALEVAERLRAAVTANVVEWESERIALTASIGVACYPHDGEDFGMLLQAADKALYRAKMLGRNTIITAG